MKETIHKGTIRISRYTGGERGSGINIYLEDSVSGCEIAEIELTAEALGNAITGSSMQECEFTLRPKNLGKTREMKTEIIPFKAKNYATRETEAKAALAPYEVDGWKGQCDSLLNHHCETNKGQRVLFTRFV